MGNEGSSSKYGKGVEEWLEGHMEFVKGKILKRASDLAARDEDGGLIGPKHIAKAAMEFAPGENFPEEIRWRKVVLTSISGVTLISALLAVAFAGIGLWASGTNGAANNAASYFDIAKLFAGAIVGSTGVAVASSTRRG